MKHLIRWVAGIAGAFLTSLALVFAVDIATNRVKFRTTIKRCKWAVQDAWHWCRRTWDQLPAILTYNLGIAQARWAILRAEVQSGKRSEELP